MNEIIKYHNDMNTVAFRKFNSRELDLFMSICNTVRDKECNSLVFTFNELQELSNIKYSTVNEFIKIIDDVYHKILNLNIKIGNSIDFIRFNLFSSYEVKGTEQKVIIKINDEFKWVFNELSARFTRFELYEFVNLKSSYTKECYRRLKQFRTTGIWQVSIDEFRRLLDIPDSYRMCDIDKWVLNPIVKELSPIFQNFKVQKIKKKGRGRGGVVDSLYFSFKPEKPNNQPISSSINKNASEGQIEPNTAQIDYKYSKEQVQKALNKLENGN